MRIENGDRSSINASPLPPSLPPKGKHGVPVPPGRGSRSLRRPVPISRPGRRPSEISNAHGRAANYSKNGGCLLFAGGSAAPRRANAPRAEPESSNPRPWNNRCPLTRSARVFASRRNRARPRVPPRISSLRFCAAVQRTERPERKSGSTMVRRCGMEDSRETNFACSLVAAASSC